MKKTLLTVFSVICLMASVHANASVKLSNKGAKVVSKGNGYTYYRIDGNEHSKTVQKETGQPAANKSDKYLYVFTNLQGVMSSSLPAIIKEDIKSEYKVTSSTNLSKIDTGLLMIDAQAAIEEARKLEQYAASQTSSAKGGGVIAPKLFGCGGRWKDRTKQHRLNLGPRTMSKGINTSGFNGSLSTTAALSGFADITINYSKRVNPCTGNIPYRFRWNHAHAFGKVNMNSSSIQLSGELFKYNKEVYSADLFDIKNRHGFWVGFIYVIIEYGIKGKMGVDVSATATATVGYASNVQGYLEFDVTCKRNQGCRENKKTVNNLRMSGDGGQPIWGVEAEATIMPFVSVVPNAGVSLYTSSFEIAKAELDLKLGVPATAWFYRGNACGDADADGNHEIVDALAFTLSAQLQARGKWNILGWDGEIDYDLPTLSGWKRETYELFNKKFKTVRKLIYFRDLKSPYSTAFTPMIMGTPSALGGLTIAARPCYPWSNELRYDIDWGDGTKSNNVNVKPSGKFFEHSWPATGNYTVTVKTKSDEFGRSFASPATTRQIHFDANGVRPPSSISIPRQVDYVVPVSWGKSSTPSVFYELYVATKSNFSDQRKIYDGTALSTGHRTGPGTYYFRVRACRVDSCSAYKEGPYSVYVTNRPPTCDNQPPGSPRPPGDRGCECDRGQPGQPGCP